MNLNLPRLSRVTLVLLIAGMCAWPAYSAAIRCRSDPAVILTDGTVIDLSADIDAALWDIKAINYTIHVPSKARVLAVIRTPNWPTTLESFTVVSDSADQRYDTSTVVVTRATGVAVQANLIVKTLRNLISMGSTSGLDRQPLRVVINTR